MCRDTGDTLFPRSRNFLRWYRIDRTSYCSYTISMALKGGVLCYAKSKKKQLNENAAAKSFSYTIRNHKRVRVSWAYSKTVEQPTTVKEKILGVDTGIRDCLYASDGAHYGSFSPVEDLSLKAFGFSCICFSSFGALSRCSAIQLPSHSRFTRVFVNCRAILPKSCPNIGLPLAAPSEIAEELVSRSSAMIFLCSFSAPSQAVASCSADGKVGFLFFFFPMLSMMQ